MNDESEGERRKINEDGGFKMAAGMTCMYINAGKSATSATSLGDKD